MKGTFLKFKKRLNALRIARSAFVGASVGLMLSGVFLILWKLAVIDFAPITTLYIGLGSLMMSGGLTFLLTHKSDKRFAEELDSEFNLKARVQTMVEYMGEVGEMVSIQRQDADDALAEIPIKKYKIKRLWIYLLILALSAVIFSLGFVIGDVRDYTPPEQIIPFELSSLQETGINNLIKYVENSEMEEEFKVPLSDELRSLLNRLKNTHTQPAMLEALDTSMKAICDITYESSTATEMLNALWDSDDIYFRHLAKVLDTSEWTDPNEETWGDFAEKIINYRAVLMGDDKNKDENSTDVPSGNKDYLKFALDNMSRKLKPTLAESGVGEDDEIYVAIDRLFNANPGGFSLILSRIDYMDDEAAREALETCFNITGKVLYDAISLNKINANVGEYSMLRLASLFIVPLPDFERPDFVKNGESVGSDQGSDDDENNNAGSDGGIGEGATFGSNDIVIDPLTGEYVEYGELFAKYYAIMYEKIDGDVYTDEQKDAIKKYFDLLYSGLEKEKG